MKKLLGITKTDNADDTHIEWTNTHTSISISVHVFSRDTINVYAKLRSVESWLFFRIQDELRDEISRARSTRDKNNDKKKHESAVRE